MEKHPFSERVLRDMSSAVLAGLEGILYEKQQNIFDVWIVHWVFGVSGTLLCLIDH
ncbi:MAG: hypothetical protein IKG97_06500 [Lachnospiraceae bacterium]|nr:hypothetical protein [Lachnospiraceae bacterium]